jgi:hypothetical protein
MQIRTRADGKDATEMGSGAYQVTSSGIRKLMRGDDTHAGSRTARRSLRILSFLQYKESGPKIIILAFPNITNQLENM